LAIIIGSVDRPARDRQGFRKAARAGDLICHERLESNVVGSGNNVLGLSRVDAMNSKNRVAGK